MATTMRLFSTTALARSARSRYPRCPCSTHDCVPPATTSRPTIHTTHRKCHASYPHETTAHLRRTETTALLGKARPPPLTLPYDSSDDESVDTRPSRWLHRLRPSLRLSDKQKMVLKCSLAYFLGSLFTYHPTLNRLIGGASTSSHVVATVTVFFNPAKTIGGMVEAAGFGLFYGIIALLLCLLSMASTVALIQRDMYIQSCIVTLGFWLTGSAFVINYFKSRINTPSIRTGKVNSVQCISTAP